MLGRLTGEVKQTFVPYVDLISKQNQLMLSSLRKFVNPAKAAGEFPSDPKKRGNNCLLFKLDKKLLKVLPLGPKFCCLVNKSKQMDLRVEPKNFSRKSQI